MGVVGTRKRRSRGGREAPAQESDADVGTAGNVSRDAASARSARRGCQLALGVASGQFRGGSRGEGRVRTRATLAGATVRLFPVFPYPSTDFLGWKLVWTRIADLPRSADAPGIL